MLQLLIQQATNIDVVLEYPLDVGIPHGTADIDEIRFDSDAPTSLWNRCGCIPKSVAWYFLKLPRVAVPLSVRLTKLRRFVGSWLSALNWWFPHRAESCGIA